jgi:hypothetical protein
MGELERFLARGLAAQHAVDVLNPSTCLACGCTDRRACPGGCSWLELDREIRIGLCSSCGDRRADWPQWRANVITALAKAQRAGALSRR